MEFLAIYVVIAVIWARCVYSYNRAKYGEYTTDNYMPIILLAGLFWPASMPIILAMPWCGRFFRVFDKLAIWLAQRHIVQANNRARKARK